MEIDDRKEKTRPKGEKASEQNTEHDEPGNYVRRDPESYSP